MSHKVGAEEMEEIKEAFKKVGEYKVMCVWILQWGVCALSEKCLLRETEIYCNFCNLMYFFVYFKPDNYLINLIQHMSGLSQSAVLFCNKTLWLKLLLLFILNRKKQHKW